MTSPATAPCASNFFNYQCPDEILLNLTAEQRDKIDALRGMLKNAPIPAAPSVDKASAEFTQCSLSVPDEATKPLSHGVDSILREFDDDDFQLHRYLRANDYDIDKAEKMYTKMIKWRLHFGTDELLSDFVIEQDIMRSIKKDYVHFYHRTDKLGRPIYIEQLGRLNMSGIKVSDKVCTEMCEMMSCFVSL